MNIQIIKVHIPYGEPEHHSAITKYMSSGNVVWEKADLISFLQSSSNGAFVKDRQGDTVFCEVVYPSSGRPYIKTKPDGILADNLLSLPRF